MQSRVSSACGHRYKLTTSSHGNKYHHATSRHAQPPIPSPFPSCGLIRFAESTNERSPTQAGLDCNFQTSNPASYKCPPHSGVPADTLPSRVRDIASADVTWVHTLFAGDPDRAFASMFTTEKYLQRHPKPLGPIESKSIPPSSHNRCRNTSCTTFDVLTTAKPTAAVVLAQLAHHAN